ncbi:MAG TPA: Holliday junction resolvase RuvX [Syntrophales bacterium]|nr:Holliday junction resolvase RuvX [Syntrophales bacterium]
MRILGIDYGEKRIGLAVSDELEITARGISVIERKSKKADLAAIAAAVSEYGVGAIVVGYPLRLDGSAGIQCEKVDRFIASLKEIIAVPVIACDEALSTKEAEGLLRETGVARRKRRGVVDRIAAAFILQDYLNRKARQGGVRP